MGMLTINLLLIILFIISLLNKMVVIQLLVNRVMLLEYKNQHQKNALIYAYNE